MKWWCGLYVLCRLTALHLRWDVRNYSFIWFCDSIEAKTFSKSCLALRSRDHRLEIFCAQTANSEGQTSVVFCTLNWKHSNFNQNYSHNSIVLGEKKFRQNCFIFPDICLQIFSTHSSCALTLTHTSIGLRVRFCKTLLFCATILGTISQKINEIKVLFLTLIRSKRISFISFVFSLVLIFSLFDSFYYLMKFLQTLDLVEK